MRHETLMLRIFFYLTNLQGIAITISLRTSHIGDTIKKFSFMHTHQNIHCNSQTTSNLIYLRNTILAWALLLNVSTNVHKQLRFPPVFAHHSQSFVSLFANDKYSLSLPARETQFNHLRFRQLVGIAQYRSRFWNRRWITMQNARVSRVLRTIHEKPSRKLTRIRYRSMLSVRCVNTIGFHRISRYSRFFSLTYPVFEGICHLIFPCLVRRASHTCMCCCCCIICCCEGEGAEWGPAPAVGSDERWREFEPRLGSLTFFSFPKNGNEISPFPDHSPSIDIVFLPFPPPFPPSLIIISSYYILTPWAMGLPDGSL